ncbi:hypothetical protein IJH66_00630 [Candidatus Saccharibacteria bacterium]|nr:hypothetical protein [Candidatus Saccharibacteria bacterium]
MLKRIVWFLVVFSLGALALYTYENPEWYRNLGFNTSDVKLAVNNCDKIIAEIEKYDWDKNVATAVMKAESKCNVNAKGDEDLIYEENGREYGYSVGAFQVRILPGREDCDTYVLETNVKCAYSIYVAKGRDFTDWSMFLNGKYLDYLE